VRLLALPAAALALGAAPAGGQAAPAATSTTPAPGPAPATEITLQPRRHLANGAAPLLVRLSAPLAPGSPSPTLVPRVAGSWRAEGAAEVFTPASALLPCSRYTLVISGRTQSVGHAPLGRRRKLHLAVSCPSITALQEALAHLGYLDARLRAGRHVRLPRAHESRREAALSIFSPPPAALVTYPANAPPVRRGQLNTITRAALEVYQSDRGLSVTGSPDRQTWLMLLDDLSTDRRDPRPYTWVQVSESQPERLWLHRGARVALTTLVNTGVAGAETPHGIFPIYLRFVSTSMAGEDPNGTRYDVPDVPWVNYFYGGDAVHGYPREAYGFPQSNGCVELPIEAARTIFPMLQIGDLVWVQ